MKKKENPPSTTPPSELTTGDDAKTPGVDVSTEEHRRIVSLFGILLGWDLRLAFHSSPDGTTLYTVADDDGAQFLDRVSRAELEGWVKQRQAREIHDQLPPMGFRLMSETRAGFVDLGSGRTSTGPAPRSTPSRPRVRMSHCSRMPPSTK